MSVCPTWTLLFIVYVIMHILFVLFSNTIEPDLIIFPSLLSLNYLLIFRGAEKVFHSLSARHAWGCQFKLKLSECVPGVLEATVAL